MFYIKCYIYNVFKDMISVTLCTCTGGVCVNTNCWKHSHNKMSVHLVFYLIGCSPMWWITMFPFHTWRNCFLPNWVTCSKSHYWNQKSQCSCCLSLSEPISRDKDWIFMSALFIWPAIWEEGGFIRRKRWGLKGVRKG